MCYGAVMDEQTSRELAREVALTQIERQFGKKISREEYMAREIERGHFCSTCQKRGIACTCNCGCKYCWGSSWVKNLVR